MVIRSYGSGVLQLMAQPRQLRVEIGQLDAEPGRRGARVEPRVVGHGLRRRLRRRAAAHERGVEPEAPPPRAARAHAVDVLAAAAVQRAVTSRSSARQISSPASVASVGVASMLIASLSQTGNGRPARSASTSAATK